MTKEGLTCQLVYAHPLCKVDVGQVVRIVEQWPEKLLNSLYDTKTRLCCTYGESIVGLPDYNRLQGRKHPYTGEIYDTMPCISSVNGLSAVVDMGMIKKSSIEHFYAGYFLYRNQIETYNDWEKWIGIHRSYPLEGGYLAQPIASFAERVSQRLKGIELPSEVEKFVKQFTG